MRINFETCAHIMASAPDSAPPLGGPGIEHRFLQFIGYLDATGRPAPTGDAAHRVRLLRFAARLDDVFALRSDTAPGMPLFGAYRSGISLGDESHQLAASYGGRGGSLMRAFEGCIGEAIEHDAMILRPDDVRLNSADAGAPGGRVRFNSIFDDRVIERTTAEVFCPLEKDGRIGRIGSSTGYAAHRTDPKAKRSAFLECLERHAIADWYLGDMSLHTILPRSDVLEPVGRARAEVDRQTTFFRLPTDWPHVWCIMAASSDTGGRQAVLGFGCDLSPRRAMLGAFGELCQGELAVQLVRRKARERGDNALNEAERRIITRCDTLDLGSGLFASGGSIDCPESDDADSQTPLDRFDWPNLDAFAADLTVPDIAVPVWTVHCPGLKDMVRDLDPSDPGPF